MVTSVSPIAGVTNSKNEYGWSVEGYEIETGRQFRYLCKRVVLASGTADSFNRLGVPGEDTYNWVTHDFKDFERKLDRSNSPLSELRIPDRRACIVVTFCKISAYDVKSDFEGLTTRCAVAAKWWLFLRGRDSYELV